VGRILGRSIARIAVLNEFSITDERHDKKTRRDRPPVENTTAYANVL
jgi:hypothetical protein